MANSDSGFDEMVMRTFSVTLDVVATHPDASINVYWGQPHHADELQVHGASIVREPDALPRLTVHVTGPKRLLTPEDSTVTAEVTKAVTDFAVMRGRLKQLDVSVRAIQPGRVLPLHGAPPSATEPAQRPSLPRPPRVSDNAKKAPR